MLLNVQFAISVLYTIVDVTVGRCAYGSASCLLKLAWYLKSELGSPDDISELYR